MLLKMVGIDYEKANLTTRERFSFQKHSAIEAMQEIQDTYGVSGVVLISTCNRTELYIHTEEDTDSALEMLCFLKDAAVEDTRQYAVEREGFEAIHHLFELGCGLKSKVFGEDQIISQVKNALSLAREADTSDSYMEKVFQTAIATAKKVKNEVHLTAVKTSVIEEMLKALNKDLGTVAGKHCMVIGNGEIGRLAARRMVEEKAKVTMTVRNYKTREVEIPDGCDTIDYKDRYQDMADYDVVISATSSPHHTIKYEDSHTLFEDDKQHILVDLAVPRDISSKYEEVPNVILYNIDTLGGSSRTEQDNEAMALALSIIREEEAELKLWDKFRKYVPMVQTIGHIGGLLTYKRMEKKAKKIVADEAQIELEEMVRKATEKTITSMLFDLRKNLPMEYWRPCMEAFEKDMLKED